MRARGIAVADRGCQTSCPRRLRACTPQTASQPRGLHSGAMSAPPEPRRHHYVPRFLLAGFTPAGTVDDFLYAHDVIAPRKRPLRQRPYTVAFETDYNRVETLDDPVAIENALCDQETVAAPIIQGIAETGELPTKARLRILFEFIATLAVRVPRHRRWLSNLVDSVARSHLHETTTKEQWDTRCAGMRGIVGHPPPPWELARDVGALRFEADHTWLVAMSLLNTELVLKCLEPRHWGLLVAVGDAPNFVCCDSPVSLIPNDSPPPGGRVLGWATPHTTALIPLTRRVVLIGSMDDAPAPYRAVRDRRVIAELNAFTVKNATRWVYSPTDEFVWRKPDGAMGHASDLRALVAEAAKA
jgi:hypothetical protein